MRVLDAFCGAGGLSMGLESAGFTIAAGIDIDYDSTETFAKAHPGAEVFLGTVADTLPYVGPMDVDVVVGGPPCQPWSTGGLQRGNEDERNGWPQFVALVERCRPFAFVAENVPGFTTTPEFPRLLDHFRAIGYGVTWAVLDAAHYGTPQHRRRLFVVGIMSARQRAFQWPEPSLNVHAVGRLRFGAEPIGEPNTAIVTYARKPDLRPDPYHGLLVNGGGRPLDLARPAPTVLASAAGNKAPWLDLGHEVPTYHSQLMAGMGPRSGIVEGARRLSATELAMVQGFGRHDHFAGSRSSQVRQIGNAVPPPLAECLGDALMAALNR